ncbi:MAG TPA: YggT family protein [Acidimicrobiia bacterium]|nr:YggT family protein [Acidimicrobiia bacterium]
MGILRSLVQLVSLALLVWIVLSYIVVFGRIPFDHPIRRLYEFLSRMIEPILRPIRAVVPPVRVGGAALDLSPLILIFGLQILAAVLPR